MLNFFCERCRRIGSVTEYCDNSKCTSFKSKSNTQNRFVQQLEKSNWEKGFQKWKNERKGNARRTRKAYEETSGMLKTSFDSSDTSILPSTTDPWANQHLVKPIGTPKEFLYSV
jgi:hypothetical protein